MAGDISSQNSTMMQYARVVFLSLGERLAAVAPNARPNFAPDGKVYDYYHAGLTADAAVAIEWEQFRRGQRKGV